MLLTIDGLLQMRTDLDKQVLNYYMQFDLLKVLVLFPQFLRLPHAC
jgi:hypothetical protein